jgi:SAM-dependent methyltransferase
MFRKSQRFYDAIYAWKDYPGEVDRLLSIIRERVPEARSLLDVACGTGRHLELLRGHFDVAGVDLDPDMVALAGERLADDVPLLVADMTAFDLGRTFDVVTCLFSSVAYAGTEDHLRAAVAAMARHVSTGGVLIVEPFFPPDQWEEGKVWAIFVDQPDLKIARMDVSRSDRGIAMIRFHYLVGTPESIEHFTEDHQIGLFAHDQYVGAFRVAGLAVEHDPEGLMGRGLYVGRRA